MTPLTVIGIGNPYRGDDGAGRAVAGRLEHKAGLHVLQMDGDASLLLEVLQTCERAIVIDAMRSGAAPGTVRRYNALCEPLPTSAQASTHGLGLAEALALGKVFDTLPRQLEFIGIEGSCFEHGANLSPAVLAAVGAVADDLQARPLTQGSGHPESASPCTSTA